MRKRYYFKLNVTSYQVFDSINNDSFVTEFSDRDEAVSYCAIKNYEWENQLNEDKSLSAS